jgi:hypothetical protein
MTDNADNAENVFMKNAKIIQENEQFFMDETKAQTENPNHIPDIMQYVDRVDKSAQAMTFLNEHCQTALGQISKIIENTATKK